MGRDPQAEIRPLDGYGLNESNSVVWTSSFQERRGTIAHIYGLPDPITFARPNRDFESYYYPMSRYLQRDLTDPNDILNAFAGVAEMLAVSWGPFYWGMPVESLWEFLDWSAVRPDSAMTRRTNYPSWSWAGWHWENSDLMYFEWMPDGQQLILIFISMAGRPRLTSPTIGCNKRSGFGGPWDGHFMPDSQRVADVLGGLEQDGIDTSQLLAMFTSSASLLLEPNLRPLGLHKYTYHINNPTTREILESVHLDEHWASRQPSVHEFIIVSYYSEGSTAEAIIYDEDSRGGRRNPCSD